MWTKVKKFDCLSLCCLERPYDRFYTVCGAVEWRCELDFEHCERMNVKERQFVGRHNLEMLAILPPELDVFYQPVQDVWAERKSFCALGIPAPIVFAHMTDKAQVETRLKR